MSDIGGFAQPLLFGLGALACVALAILLWRGDRDAGARAADALPRAGPVNAEAPAGFLTRWAMRRRATTWARHDRARRRRLRLRRSVPALSLVALAVTAGTGVLLLPDPPQPGAAQRRDGLLHPRNCQEARRLGYGNAIRGEVGYFAHLDADNDGISCEPLPMDRR
jgi:hypothetical protein